MNKFNADKAGNNMDEDFQAWLREITPQGEMQEREREKKEQNQRKADEYNQLLAQLDPLAVEKLQREVSAKIGMIERQIYTELEEFYAYFDLDMFFAACEISQRPELADVPFVVGYSVVSTANYAARKFNIRSGMPGFLALKLCPHLKVLKTDFPKYRLYSDLVFEIIGQYDDEAVKRGIDEGYFKIRLEDPSMLQDPKLVEEFIDHTISEIKKEIKEKTSLTMSVGVSFNPRIAKMAAEKNKPDGLFILRKRPQDVYAYLNDLKVRKISGVGPQLEDILARLEIHTIKDLRDNLWKIFSCFSESQALSLLEDTVGYAIPGEHETISPSISREQTFKATDDPKFLEAKIRSLADLLLLHPRLKESYSKNLSIKVKYFDFKVRNKSVTVDNPLNSAAEITDLACQLLKQTIDRPIRLIGIRLGNLVPIEELKRKSVVEIIKERKEAIPEPLSALEGNMDFVCPVCFKKVDVMGVKRAFERHVNECLEKGENEQPTQAQTRSNSSKKKKSGDKRVSKHSKN